MATGRFSWKFPQRELHRIELLFIGKVAVLLFLLILPHGWALALAVAALYLGLYVLLARWLKRWHRSENHYLLSRGELHITKQRRIGNAAQDTERVALRHLRRHKLDYFFLGGYLVSREGKKHLVYFNSRAELEKFLKELKRQVVA